VQRHSWLVPSLNRSILPPHLLQLAESTVRTFV